jgi:hypothetical protein
MVLVMMSVSLVLDHAGDCCYQDGLVVAMQESCEQKQRRAGFVGSAKEVAQMADPTLEALAQDHWNDSLSNTIA